MNLRSTLEHADPARRLPAIDPDERLLSEIVSADAVDLAQRSPTAIGPRRDRRPLLATAVIALAVTVVALIAIRVAPHIAPAPAATAMSQKALEDAVFTRLSQVATGDIPVRQKSATTWTSGNPGGDGGAIDLSGKTLYIAAACDGGGSIAIRLTGRRDSTLDCSRPSTIGPIDVTAEITSGARTAGIDVVVASGRPHYVAKMMAFPAATTSTAAAPCTPMDFTITAHLEGTVMNHTQSPVWLVENRTTPCALVSDFVLDTIRGGHRVSAARLSLASVAQRGYPLAPEPGGTYVIDPGARLALRIVGVPKHFEAGVGTYDRPAWLRINGTSVRLPSGDLPSDVVDHGLALRADPR